MSTDIYTLNTLWIFRDIFELCRQQQYLKIRFPNQSVYYNELLILYFYYFHFIDLIIAIIVYNSNKNMFKYS